MSLCQEHFIKFFQKFLETKTGQKVLRKARKAKRWKKRHGKRIRLKRGQKALQKARETENKAKLEGVLDILRWSLTVKRAISNALSFEYEKTVTVTREEPILSASARGASQGFDNPFAWAHIFQSPIEHMYYLADYYYFFELDDDSTWRGGTNGVSFRVTSTMETSGGKVVLDAYPSFRFSTPK